LKVSFWNFLNTAAERGREILFTISHAALDVLDWAIKQEQTSEDEKLFVRLTMGHS